MALGEQMLYSGKFWGAIRLEAATGDDFSLLVNISKPDCIMMFSGPRDYTETWQSLPSATPSNRFFGFSHMLDLGWTEGHYPRSWQMLGLEKYGPLVNVDKASPPYGNTRRLITDCNVDNNPNRAHTAVIPGGTAAKDPEGKFIHENVWRNLFTHPIDQTGEPDPADTNKY